MQISFDGGAFEVGLLPTVAVVSPVRVRGVASAAPTSVGMQEIRVPLYRHAPKAALLITTFSSVGDGSLQNSKVFTASVTDGVSSVGIGASSQDGVAASNTARIGQAIAAIFTGSATGTTTGAAAFAAWIPGGIRLNWNLTPAVAWKVTAIFFFGDDAQASVGIATPGATTDPDVDITTGFKPDALISLNAIDFFGATWSANLGYNIGFAARDASDDSIDQLAVFYDAADALNPTEPRSLQINGGLASSLVTDTTTFRKTAIAAVAASGFSVKSIAGSAAGTSAGPSLGYLALQLGGKHVDVRPYSSGISGGVISLATVPFKAQAFIAVAMNGGDVSWADGTIGLTTTAESGGIGYADESTLAMWDGWRDKDAVTPSQAQSNMHETRPFDMPDGTGADAFVANFASFDSDSINLSVIARSGGPHALGIITIESEFRILKASATGVASTSANLKRKRALDAAATGIASTSAVLKRDRAFDAAATGVASTSAILKRDRALAGSASGTASASAELSVRRALSGSAAGVASTTGVLSRALTLAGSATGVASVTAELSRLRAFDGSAAGVAATTAELSKVTGFTTFIASASGVAATAAELSRLRRLAGSASGAASTSGDLNTDRTLTGSSSGSASTSAELSRLRALDGSSAGAASTSADFNVGEITFSGSSNGVATCSATLTVIIVCAPEITELDITLMPAVFDLLERVGKTAIFLLPGAKAFDATQGSTSQPAPASFTRKVTPPDRWERRYVEGNTAQESNARVFVAGKDLPFTPSLTTQVLLDGATWEVVAIQPIFSGDLVCAYELKLSGGSLPSVLSTSSAELDTLVDTALDIIERLGRTVEVQTFGSITFDPAQGQTTYGPPSDFTVKSSPLIDYSDEYVVAGTARDGDASVFVAAKGLQFLPELALRVIADSAEWKVVRVLPIYSGQRIALWELHLRGGSLPVPGALLSGLDFDLLPAARDIIDRLGKHVIFCEEDSDVFNVLEGATIRTGAQDFCVKATPPEGFEKKFINGSTVRAGDRKISVAGQGLPFFPKKGMKVTVDDTVWRITRVQPISSGSQVALYTLQLRK